MSKVKLMDTIEEAIHKPIQAIHNVNLLNDYIRALILNINPANLPRETNLIFDSGAVNGVYGIGAALYIHNLEKSGYMKIRKISGCSIGALIATWYICECPDTIHYYTDLLFSYYKKNNEKAR